MNSKGKLKIIYYAFCVDSDFAPSSDRVISAPLPTPKGPKQPQQIHFTMPNPEDSYDSENEVLTQSVLQVPCESPEEEPPLARYSVASQFESNGSRFEMNSSNLGSHPYKSISDSVKKHLEKEREEFYNSRNNSPFSSTEFTDNVWSKPPSSGMKLSKAVRDDISVDGQNYENGSSKPKNCVRFDEESNTTVDIPSRDENELKVRHGARKPDIKNVKSKIDSGYHRIIPATKMKRTNSDQSLYHNMSGPLPPSNRLKKRPYSAKISTLTVTYDGGDKVNKTLNNNKKDVNDLMSRMNVNDDSENNNSNSSTSSNTNNNHQRPESRHGNTETTTKCKSRPSSSSHKNYYEVAMNRRKVKDNEQINDTAGTIGDIAVKKTVKTLELLGDNELKEMKFVQVIGSQVCVL